MAKAFDKVPHKRLLEKLRKHGIGGKVLRILSSWLQGRKQRVCILCKFSKWIEVEWYTARFDFRTVVVLDLY